MNEEALALCSMMCAREITRLSDMTPVEIESLLNAYAEAARSHRSERETWEFLKANWQARWDQERRDLEREIHTAYEDGRDDGYELAEYNFGSSW